ncbi:hypothetical protein LSPH24S_03154 [Lysinibacillus sphaericus]
MWTTNVPEWLSLQFGTGKMGAPIVTVNTNYRAHELEYLLRQSDAKTIILIENFRDHSFIHTLQEYCRLRMLHSTTQSKSGGGSSLSIHL